MIERGAQTSSNMGRGFDQASERAIPREMNRQQSAIENLEGRVEALRDRLAAVMSCRNELKAVGGQIDMKAPRPSAGCDTADSINAKTCRIEEVATAIDNILSRLEV